MIRRKLPVTPALVSVLLAACNAHELHAPDPRPETQPASSVLLNPTRQLDLLFVIDNSISMSQEQEKLRARFRDFMAVLQGIEGGLPDIHVAVVSSDVGAGNTAILGNPACNRPGGDRGVFQVKPECGLQDGARFLIATAGETSTNYPGRNLEDVFSCMANLGTTGCGFEHQLQAMRVALAEGVTPQNAGFLRPSAFLAIIIITDEDDCSAPPESDFFVDPAFATSMEASLRCSLAGHRCDGRVLPHDVFSTALAGCEADPDGGGRLIPVREFVAFVNSLKANPTKQIVVSAIAGWPDKLEGTPYAIVRNAGQRLDNQPACSAGDDGTAAPALRVRKFVEAFGGNGSVESICNNDFRPALTNIANLIRGTFERPPCVTEKLLDSDLDPANGFQPECSIVERVPDEVTGGFNDKIIGRACNDQSNPGASTNKPCFVIRLDGQCAESLPNYTVGPDRWLAQVFRDGPPPPDTLQIVKCRGCGKDDPALCR